MEVLENKFNDEMINIYNIAKKDLNYNASRFLQLVVKNGGIQAAKKLVSKTGGTYGFEILWENNRLDLSVEALVLRSEYKELFSDEERQICGERLNEFGYKNIEKI